jgi:hypothetical protein
MSPIVAGWAVIKVYWKVICSVLVPSRASALNGSAVWEYRGRVLLPSSESYSDEKVVGCCAESPEEQGSKVGRLTASFNFS